MEKQELDTLIDNMVLGILTADEKSKLDKYIKENPNIMAEIQMRNDLKKGIEYNADQELKQVLNKIHLEEISSKQFNYWRLLIGILVSLILAFGIYSAFTKVVSKKNPSIDNQRGLYAQCFEPFNPSVESRSGGTTPDEDYQKFVNEYRTGNFAKSLETIRPYLKSADSNTLLMAGISAMENGQLSEAQTYFDEIISKKDFYFQDHAKWYKGLLFIKMNKLQDAKSIISDLANDTNADHHDESVLLLKEF